MNMEQWTPARVVPEVGKELVLCRQQSSGTRVLMVGRYVADMYRTDDGGYEPSDTALVGWMYAEPLLTLPRGYDPKFGDARLCKCGHAYYRHFDPFEDMAPVGCKYCHERVAGISHRKEVPVPEGTDIADMSTWTEQDWQDYRNNYASICTGYAPDYDAISATERVPELCQYCASDDRNIQQVSYPVGRSKDLRHHQLASGEWVECAFQKGQYANSEV